MNGKARKIPLFPLVVIGLVLLVAVLVFWPESKAPPAPKPVTEPQPLMCHVGGTMKPVLQELANRYQAKTGQAVEINSAGSGELLAHIEMQKEGDIYVCHDPFVDILMKKYKMGVDAWRLAELTPVIVVQKGNPKGIHGIKDLARPDVEVILTDYKKSSLGRMLPTIFAKAGLDFEAFNQAKNITTNKSGGYAANYVKMKNADAAIVWNAVAWLRRDALDVVPISSCLPTPYVDTVTSATGKCYVLTPLRVTAATLTCSRQPDRARAFLEYLASDEGSEVFAKFGFTMSGKRRLYVNGVEQVSGRKAAEKLTGVRLKLYAGAGLRPAVEKLVKAFEFEKGITVEPDYAGSGMLLARARASGDADVFLPGDTWYVDRLQRLAGTVAERKAIAWFVPVIIVYRGNPKNIHGLKDFFRPDVSVGLGKADACQIGRISAKIFAKNDLDRKALTCKESLTVNELAVWVKMRDVDAAVVWDAIAANLGDQVEVVAIPPEKNVISRVEAAVLTTSKNKPAAREFVDFLAGDKGRMILRQVGYRVDDPR